MEGDQFCLETSPYQLTERRWRILKLSGASALFMLLTPTELLPTLVVDAAKSAQQLITQVEAQIPEKFLKSPLLAVAWVVSGIAVFSTSSVVREYLSAPRLMDRLAMFGINLAYKLIPAFRAKMDKELNIAMESMKKSVLKPVDEIFTELPAKSLSYEEVDTIIARRTKGEREHYTNGKISGTVYFVDEEREKYLASVQGKFGLSNLLHPEMFPAVRQMEAEIVRMVANMFRGDERTGGAVHSGGTESLLMAVKAYRDWGKLERGIEHPEIILSTAAHAAFDKAGCYFADIKLVQIKVDEATGEIDLKAVKRAINRSTVMIVGSAPSYPRGVMDNIPALGKLAQRYGVGLHVDCCLGSFVAPHQRLLSNPKHRLPYEFDFQAVPGVTSISCDTHKFGLAPKGTSVLVYRDTQLRSHQFFTCVEWTGGIYASPSIAGSRAGSAIAAAWAALLTMGKQGYLETCEKVITCSKTIAEGISTGVYVGDNDEDIIDDEFVKSELTLLGRPDSCVVAFKTRTLPIYAVTEAMGNIGDWHLNNLQNPSGVHICVTAAVAGENPTAKAREFLRDLRKSIHLVKEKKSELVKQGGAAMYGMAATVPQALVARIAKSYFDVLMMIAPAKKEEEKK